MIDTNATKPNTKFKKIAIIILGCYIVASGYLYFCVWNRIVKITVTDFSATEIKMLSEELSVDFPDGVNISQGVYSNADGLYLKVSGVDDMCGFVNDCVGFDEYTLGKEQAEEILAFLQNSTSDEADEREKERELNVSDVYNSYQPSYNNLDYGRAVSLKDTINDRETDITLYYDNNNLTVDIHISSVKNKDLRKVFKPLFAKRYK